MSKNLNTENKFLRFLLLVLGSTVVCLILISIVIEKGSEVVWINSLHNRFLDIFFYLITSLGNGLLVIPFLMIGLMYKFRFAVVSAISFSLLGVACPLFKFLFNQPRPIAILDNTALHFVPGVVVHSHNSFPSGHSATIFCLTVLIALSVRSRRATLFLILLASLVGLSRIYLLQHFLIDVAAGALLGSSIGLSVWLVVRKFNQPWLDARFNTSRKKSNAEVDLQLPSLVK